MHEEAGHIVFHTEHVEHDMDDDTGERTKTMHNTTNANGEQTEIVIENEIAEAEAEGVEGQPTETMLDDAVEAAGGTGEEHSDLSTVIEESGHIAGEDHHARCAHWDEEAGSVVLHVSSDMNEKETDDEEAGETAAAKETEEISKEDVEIRRVIEERRRIPKEEKQRLKEVSKCRKMYQRQKKNENTAKHPKNTWRLQRCKKHPKVLITKIKNERGKIIKSRTGIANVFGEFYKNKATTKNKMNLNMKS